MRLTSVLLLPLALSVATAQTFTRPLAGFEANVGQIPSDALFASERLICFTDRLEVRQERAALTIRVPGIGTRFQFSEPLEWTLNRYLGTDPTKWRAAIPHYRVAGNWQVTPRGPSVRLFGAQELTFDSNVPISLTGSSDGAVSVVGLRDPATGRPDSFEILRLVVSGASFVDGNRIQIRTLSNESEILFPEPASFGNTEVDSTGSVAMYGPGWVAKFSANGNPVYLSRFSGDLGGGVLTSPSRTVVAGQTYGGLSVTPGAPTPAYQGDLGNGRITDSFLAVFGPTGALIASTYVSGELFWSVHDTGDALVFSGAGNRITPTPGAYQRAPSNEFIGKWRPGSSAFEFLTYVPGRPWAMEVDAAGNIVFAGLAEPHHLTTPGVLKRDYDGLRNISVAKLSRDGSTMLWGTYVPLSGIEQQPGFIFVSALALDPSGEIWVGARLQYSQGFGNVLVRLASDGSTLRHAEGLNYQIYALRTDRSGEMRILGQAEFSNLFTSLNAPRRGLCGSHGLYYETRTRTGATSYATYIPGEIGSFSFTRTGRFFVYSADGARIVDPAASRPHEIACIVNAADRQFSTIVPGGLAIVFGARLGPLQEAWSLPPHSAVELAGVRVLFNDRPAKLISVQAGAILLQVPETLVAAHDVRVYVEWNGLGFGAMKTVSQSFFRLLAQDGSGRGAAALVTENGAINTSVRPGSVVSVFGTGLNGEAAIIEVNRRRAEVLYSGPAPGLIPGVEQVNFRVPLETAPGKATVTAYGGQTGISFYGDPWPRVTIEVR